MAGRLQKYNDFIQKSKYNMQAKKPLKNSDAKQVKKKLQSDNINLIFQSSKKNSLIFCLFYSKQGKKVYRFVVIPKKTFIKRGKMYIQMIDIKSLTRKLFRFDRIINAKLTQKKFKVNQSSIMYKK